VAECLLEAFERIQIFPPSLTSTHIISGRRSANLLLSDWSGNHGVNLFAVDQIAIPLVPGKAQYDLPIITMQLLDVYLRQYVPNTGAAINLGHTLTPVGPPGNPLVAQPEGDPLIIQPASNTLSSVAGSADITLRWPSHGLSPGEPIFWGCPVTVGGLTLSSFSIVDTVIDIDHVQFLAGSPAVVTQTNQGGTPLFSTNAGSPNVDVILPGHGLSVGDSWPVSIAINIGGFTIAANTSETVTAVASSYQFSFQPGGNASSTQSIFQNGGQINVTSQATTSGQPEPQDILMFPLSRNDYAAIPQKFVAGRPTSYWFNRIKSPNFSIYPLVQQGFFYGFVAYRLRQIQDANPTLGQIPDMPNRFWEPFIAGLSAKVAEKFRPEVHATKLGLASAAWEQAAYADVEHATMNVKPNFAGYFR
jgi:hypothetical protein